MGSRAYSGRRGRTGPLAEILVKSQLAGITGRPRGCLGKRWRLRLEPEWKINPVLKAGLAWDTRGWLAEPAQTSALLPTAAPGFFRITPAGISTSQNGLTLQQELDRAWVAYQPEAGKRALMIKEPGATASVGGGPRKINIVLSWFEELKQRVLGK